MCEDATLAAHTRRGTRWPPLFLLRRRRRRSTSRRRRVQALRRVVPAGGDVCPAARGARIHVVTGRPGLGATEIAFQALRPGPSTSIPSTPAPDCSRSCTKPPVPILRQSSPASPRVPPPLGHPLARRRSDSRTPTPSRSGQRPPQRYTLKPSATSRASADSLTAGLTPDFIGRPDGLPGLRRLRHQFQAGPLARARRQVPGPGVRETWTSSTAMPPTASSQSTDSWCCEDDRHFFPPYEAAALVGTRACRGAAGSRPRPRRTERPSRRSDHADA